VAPDAEICFKGKKNGGENYGLCPEFFSSRGKKICEILQKFPSNLGWLVVQLSKFLISIPGGP